MRKCDFIFFKLLSNYILLNLLVVGTEAYFCGMIQLYIATDTPETIKKNVYN